MALSSELCWTVYLAATAAYMRSLDCGLQMFELNFRADGRAVGPTNWSRRTAVEARNDDARAASGRGAVQPSESRNDLHNHKHIMDEHSAMRLRRKYIQLPLEASRSRVAHVG